MSRKAFPGSLVSAFLASSEYRLSDLETPSLAVIREVLFRLSGIILVFSTGGSAIFLLDHGFHYLAAIKGTLSLMLMVHSTTVFSRNHRLFSARALIMVGFISLIGTVAAGYAATLLWGFVFPPAFYLIVEKRDSIILSIAWFFIASILALSIYPPGVASNYILALGATALLIEVLCLILYRHEDNLKQLARRDPLTNALNRRALIEITAEFLRLHKRYQTRYSAIMMDVDHFKSINDRFGHEEGDRVLKALVNIISQRIRETDKLFRVGGEEFAVILPDTNASAATRVAESLCDVVRNSELTPKTTVTISCGVAEVIAEEGVDDWLQRGDRALYQAKHNGRDQVAIAAPQ